MLPIGAMSQPLLNLDQEWHRQRATLRANHLRPPPLVTAGLDLVHQPDLRRSKRVQVSGMALIFGIFPSNLAEFIELARTRLRLGQGSDSQRAELTGILSTRIQALWAWMPTLSQDCYLEFDHATGTPHIWLIGPGPDDQREIDADDDHRALDEAFLSALVITSTKHWGGQDGLERLIERFGRKPLLVAAQVAEALERDEVREAFELARQRWPRLDDDDESTWEPIAEEEQAWVCVQLGRLALRLALPRAARHLLGQARFGDVSAVAWFDLGQACETLDDLAGAEAAFARFANHHGEDPDGWRRLLFCRLRLGQWREADQALKRFRAAGGEDAVLVDRLANTLRHVPLSAEERPRLVGWLGTRLATAMRKKLPLRTWIADLRAEDPAGALAFDAALFDLRVALRGLLPPRPSADPAKPAAPSERAVESLCRIALLCLPFAGGPIAPAAALAGQVIESFAIWARLELDPPGIVDGVGLRRALDALARVAVLRPQE